MAEVAAGLWAAEEVVSTSVQAGVAAYMVAQPTLPLKATLVRIATSTDDSTRSSLCRSEHTVTAVGNRAYIFGGTTASGQLASNDIHAITLTETPNSKEPLYSILPAVTDSDKGPSPASRRKHAACALSDVCIAIFGGVGHDNNVIEEDADIWIYNLEKSCWQSLSSVDRHHCPSPRSAACFLSHGNSLVLVGGEDAAGLALRDCWTFDLAHETWARLPDLPAPAMNSVVAENVLHVISCADGVGAHLHSYDMSQPSASAQGWSTIEFPAHPFGPGPRARIGAGLLLLSTGYGRHYLIYLFGRASSAKDTSSNAGVDALGDIWAYQLPSSSPELKPTAHVVEAMKPAHAKDTIRGALGAETGQHHWAEVLVQPPEVLEESNGKLHPGPRAFAAFDAVDRGKSMFMWGGVNPKGEAEGDGWIVKFV